MHEVFLQRLAAHPTLRSDVNFKVFLEYDQDVSRRSVIVRTVRFLWSGLQVYRNLFPSVERSRQKQEGKNQWILQKRHTICRRSDLVKSQGLFSMWQVCGLKIHVQIAVCRCFYLFDVSMLYICRMLTNSSNIRKHSWWNTIRASKAVQRNRIAWRKHTKVSHSATIPWRQVTSLAYKSQADIYSLHGILFQTWRTVTSEFLPVWHS